MGWLFQDINSFQAISFSPSVDSISVLVLIRVVVLRLWNVSYLAQCTLTQSWTCTGGLCLAAALVSGEISFSDFGSIPSGSGPAVGSICWILNPSTVHVTFVHTVGTTKAVLKQLYVFPGFHGFYLAVWGVCVFGKYVMRSVRYYVFPSTECIPWAQLKLCP